MLAGYGLYAALFIYHTSFLVGGQRYFDLFDDAMVSMRYARNLANGWGLVWNPGGPRVEGYTNPLWVLYMALWHLGPLPPALVSLPIQISGAACLLLNLWVVRRLADLLSGGVRAVALGAVVCTALYLPLNMWSLQGLEVGPLALLVSLAAWRALAGLQAERVSLGLYGVLGVGILVRLDMVVPLLIVTAGLVLLDRRHGWVHLGYGAATLGSAVGLQTGLRLWYYGDLLPNTYYLKLTGYPVGLRVAHGLQVFGQFVWRLNPALLVLPAGACLRRRPAEAGLLAALVVGQAGYSIYVGGDAWESWGGSNRYLSIVMPVLFVLLSWAVWQTIRWRGRGYRVLLASLAALLAGTATVNAIGYTPTGWASGLAATAALGTGTYALLRLSRLPTQGGPATFAVLVGLAVLNLNAIHAPGAAAEWFLLKPTLADGDDAVRVEQARVVDSITDPQARIAVVWAGTLPYFADRTMLDILGKTDVQIAHEAVHPLPGTPAYRNFTPGHMKWDYAYTIGRQQPDVIAQLWDGVGAGGALKLKAIPADAVPYLAVTYVRVTLHGLVFYLRRGSTHVDWRRVAPENGK